MSKTALFITSSKDLYLYANLYLNKSISNVSVEFANSVSEAIAKLEVKSDYDVLYLGSHIVIDQPLKDLTKSLLPIINAKATHLFGTNSAFKGKEWAQHFHAYTPKSNILIKIYKEIFKEEKEQLEYIPIPLIALVDFEFFPFDCYLKFKSKAEEGPKVVYKKVYKAGDEVYFEDINKYRTKGVEEIFVNSKQLEEQLVEMSGKIGSDDEEEEITEENSSEVHSNSLDYVSDLLSDSGINVSAETKQITKKSFEVSKDLVKRTVKTKKELKALLGKEDSFYYKHITLTSIICCYLLDELHLTDERLKEKLCLCANLHNIFLNNTDELIVDSEVQLARFKADRQKVVLEHASAAAVFFDSNEAISSDTIKIIREHHGSQSGKEFPTTITSYLKMSVIFQISTLFAQKYLVETDIKSNLDVNVMNIFNKIHDNVETPDKTLLKALRSVVQDLTSS